MSREWLLGVVFGDIVIRENRYRGAGGHSRENSCRVQGALVT